MILSSSEEIKDKFYKEMKGLVGYKFICFSSRLEVDGKGSFSSSEIGVLRVNVKIIKNEIGVIRSEISGKLPETINCEGVEENKCFNTIFESVIEGHILPKVKDLDPTVIH